MHLFIKKPIFSKCTKCGKEVLPHCVCGHCGYYKNREIINILEKLTKKERKKREKEMHVKEEAERKEEKSLSMEGLSKR